MREIIPSLSTTYAVASILLLMLLIAGISLYFNARNETVYRGTLFWLKLILSAPLLLLGIGLTIFYTTGFIVFLLVGSGLNLKLILLTLVPISLYAITVWGLVRWIRNKRYANVSVIIGIIVFVCIIFVFQRAWICKPLAKIGIGNEQKCITQYDLELQDLERWRQQELLEREIHKNIYYRQ